VPFGKTMTLSTRLAPRHVFGLALLCVLPFLSAAHPAAAQQRDEQEPAWAGLVDGIEGCIVQAGRDPSRQLACIGEHARHCAAGPENQTTLGQEQCRMQELRAWDSLLNRYYRERPPGEKGRALMSVQRAWIAYRDLRCGYYSIYHHGGSIARLRAADCLLDETARRALELRGFRSQAP